MFEGVRHDWYPKLLLSLTGSDRSKQRKFKDHELTPMKNHALEKLHRQSMLNYYTALELAELYFLPNKWLIQL